MTCVILHLACFILSKYVITINRHLQGYWITLMITINRQYTCQYFGPDTLSACEAHYLFIIFYIATGYPPWIMHLRELVFYCMHICVVLQESSRWLIIFFWCFCIHWTLGVWLLVPQVEPWKTLLPLISTIACYSSYSLYIIAYKYLICFIMLSLYCQLFLYTASRKC